MYFQLWEEIGFKIYLFSKSPPPTSFMVSVTMTDWSLRLKHVQIDYSAIE